MKVPKQNKNVTVKQSASKFVKSDLDGWLATTNYKGCVVRPQKGTKGARNRNNDYLWSQYSATKDAIRVQ